MSNTIKILISCMLFLISCNSNDVSTVDEISDDVVKREAKLDSIQKAELQKDVTLKKVSVEINSKMNVEFAIPLSRHFSKLLTGDLDIELVDTLSDESRIIQLLGPSDGNHAVGEICVAPSDDSTLFSVKNIIENNFSKKIIYETKNSTIFSSFGDKYQVYVRHYDPVRKCYFLYSSLIENNGSFKAYADSFSSLMIGMNLFSINKTVLVENITWENIKSSLLSSELDEYNTNYGSLRKDIKFFLRDRDIADLTSQGNLYLYRIPQSGDGHDNLIKQIAERKFDGPLGELIDHSDSYFFTRYLAEKYHDITNFKFEKSISTNTVLVSVLSTTGYDEDSKQVYSYFSLTSIKTVQGQFYLISESNSSGDDMQILANDFFSKNLSI